MNADATTEENFNEHTPAKWIHRHSYVVNQSGDIIAICHANLNERDPGEARSGAIGEMERDANAELIASAPSLLRERNHLLEVNRRLVEAAQAFVDKCDQGQARSTQSYNQFKAALAFAKDQP